MDQYLYPKISDFGLSKITGSWSNSMNFKSQKGRKGTLAYMAPEVALNEEYSKSGDVYAFGFIVFEILSNEIPFKDLSFSQFNNKVIKQGYRPEIKSDIPDPYRSIIEQCWSQEAEKCPTFDEIVNQLKKDEFIDELIDEVEFLDYVDYIDSYKSTFDITNRVIHFSDFIKTQGRRKSVKIFSIDKKESETPTITVSSIDLSSNLKIDDEILPTNNNQSQIKDIQDENNTNSIINLEKDEKKVIDQDNIIKIKEEDKVKVIETGGEIKIKDDIEQNTYDFVFPQIQFDELSEANQSLVLEAENDGNKQFEVAKYLISGENGFPHNINLGIRYVIKSIKHKCIDAKFFYLRQLIKGGLIPQDLQYANDQIFHITKNQDTRLLLLKGIINRKMNRYSEAAYYLSEGIHMGDSECMYQYGKMLFIGEGIKKDQKEAKKYFELSKEKGFKKGEYFILSLERLHDIKEFNELPAET